MLNFFQTECYTLFTSCQLLRIQAAALTDEFEHFEKRRGTHQHQLN